MKWQYTHAYVEALSRCHVPKHVQKQKGSLAKTMAVHVGHDFWYIEISICRYGVRPRLRGLCRLTALR